VSTQEQVEEGHNLEEDRQRIREYAGAQGWELVEVYDDGGLQGDDPDRPGLLAMLAALPDLDAVVIRSQERISRDTVLWGMVTRAFLGAGTRLHTFTNGPVDLETPQGEFVGNLFAAVGRFEKRLTGQRVKQARAARERQGLVPGGQAPYGLRWQGGHLVEVPAQAEVVRRIYRDYAAGVSQRALVRALAAEGVLTAPWRSTPAKPWVQSGIARVLRQPLYAGLLPDGSPAVHAPIVDPDLWHRVQAIRAGHLKRKQGRQPEGRHLLTKGLLRCSCGSAMLPEKAQPGPKGGRERYICGGRREHGPDYCPVTGIRRELIDAPFLAALLDGHVDLAATVSRIEQRQSAALADSQESAAQADREAAAAEAKLARVRGDYQAGKIEADDWREQRPGLTAELEAAQQAADRARSHAETLAQVGLPDAEQALLEALTALKAAVATGVDRAPDLAALRIVLRQMFTCVVLAPNVEDEGFLLLPEPRIERLPSGDWAFEPPALPDICICQGRPTAPPERSPRSRGGRSRRSSRCRRC
jgi:DNA invertase Pin-like site-specific DNA recombinase